MALVLRILAVLAFFGFAGPVFAEMQKTRLTTEGPRFMRVYGTAFPPHGFVKFCDRYPRECAQEAATMQRFELTAELRRHLDLINRGINRKIKPATDLELYGVSEFWTLPMDRGDCEDYALLKRHVLIQEGWPASALLMTVVRDEKGEGHAVLTVRTAQGDFVLDNKVDDLKLWSETPYEFVMRQSYINPRVWMSLDPMDGVAPGAIAGVDRQR
ncbi:MAG: transglutaminase-like cysteine peptidase [Hyphomicrobiaceae bacterium]